MDEFHRNALTSIRDANPPLTMDAFIEAQAPLGRVLWLKFSQQRLAEKGPNEVLRITEAGRAVLGR